MAAVKNKSDIFKRATIDLMSEMGLRDKDAAARAAAASKLNAGKEI